MPNPWADDLRVAEQTEVAVELDLFTGEHLLTGVQEVNETEGWVKVYAPQTFGGDLTTRRLQLDAIISVTVTDVSYPHPQPPE